MIDLAYIAYEISEDFEEAVRLGAEAGVHCLALRSHIWGTKLEKLTDDEVNRAKEVLARYDSKVSAIYSAVGKCNIKDPSAVEENGASLSPIIGVAKAFGTRLVRVFPYQRPNVVEYESSHLDEYLSLISERWLPLIEQAEREGVVLCFEGVGSTLARSARDMRRVVDALGRSPSLGVIWEIDVAWRDGEPPSRGYPLIKSLIHDVHVKPNPELPLAGLGESYEQALNNLLQDGYDGPVTVEHWKTTEAALSALGELKAILARLL